MQEEEEGQKHHYVALCASASLREVISLFSSVPLCL